MLCVKEDHGQSSFCAVNVYFLSWWRQNFAITFDMSMVLYSHCRPTPFLTKCNALMVINPAGCRGDDGKWSVHIAHPGTAAATPGHVCPGQPQ